MPTGAATRCPGAIRLRSRLSRHTLPGVLLRSALAKGVKRTSTLSLAFGENGVFARAGCGPYLRGQREQQDSGRTRRRRPWLCPSRCTPNRSLARRGPAAGLRRVSWVDADRASAEQSCPSAQAKIARSSTHRSDAAQRRLDRPTASRPAPQAPPVAPASSTASKAQPRAQAAARTKLQVRGSVADPWQP